MNRKTAVVVVTYNRKNLLEENIQALLSQTNGEFDIFIIDNHSSDGTEELVKRYMLEDDRIRYINTGDNLGGAGGFSYGMNEVMKQHYEYCWIMDDDTIPSEGAFESLVNKATILKNDFSFLCSYVKWIDGSLCKMNIPGVKRALFSKFDLLQYHLLLVKTCSFVSVFINLNIARQVGLPIKEFFIYGDDAEYTLRLSREKNGYWDFDSIVTHKMAANLGINLALESEERIERHYYNVRNLTYIGKKYGWNGIPTCILATIGNSVNVLFHANDKKLKRLSIIWRGFFAGLFFNPPIIKKYQ